MNDPNRRAIRRLRAIGLLAAGLLVLLLPASALAGSVSFSGQFSSDGPLLIVPHDNAETVTIPTTYAPVYLIQRMPVNKTIGTVTLGDFGGGFCWTDRTAQLFVYDRPTHDYDGSGTEIAYTNSVPLPSSPRRLTWSFDWTASGGGTLQLQAGHTYSFELSVSGCASFKETTWAPADSELETPAGTCISGLPFQTGSAGPRRQWHYAGITPGSACVNYPANWAADWWPFEPDGWLVSISPGAQAYIAALQNTGPGTNPAQPCDDPSWADEGITQVNVEAPTGPGETAQIDGICTWDHYHDPGLETDYGWSTALPLRSEFDAAPRLPYVGLGVPPEIAFRPKLLFDAGEKWRPLNVDTFLNERNPIDNLPVQCVGTSYAGCTPVEGVATLREHYSTDDRIFQGAWNSAPASTVDDYRTSDTTCPLEDVPGADHTLLDCDSGSAATIYYNALTRSAGYNYYDYWFFYRYNEFIDDNHQADWEHVTVAQSLTDPTTFDWVNFFEHKYSTDYSSSAGGFGGNYLRDNLTCDEGGALSCGSDLDGTAKGQRVWVYAAAGSHASYPIACSSACAQPGLATLEGDHGGEAPWGANDDPGGLTPFPDPVGWDTPSEANWTDWPGRWGEEGAPASPGSTTVFKCPWNGNPADATACSARARKTARAAAVTRAGTRCAGWYGDAVIAAACTPSALRPAVKRGRVGVHGPLKITVHGRGRRAADARGIAQAVGIALRPGDTVVVHGLRARDTEVMVRAAYGKRVKQWILRGLDRSHRTVTVRLPADRGGRPRITYN